MNPSWHHDLSLPVGIQCSGTAWQRQADTGLSLCSIALSLWLILTMSWGLWDLRSLSYHPSGQQIEPQVWSPHQDLLIFPIAALATLDIQVHHKLYRNCIFLAMYKLSGATGFQAAQPFPQSPSQQVLPACTSTTCRAEGWKFEPKLPEVTLQVWWYQKLKNESIASCFLRDF